MMGFRMIRLLDLNGQIWARCKEFVFYDTRTGTILSFDEEQVFDDWEDFLYAYNLESEEKYSLKRLSGVIPENFFGQEPEEEIIVEIIDFRFKQLPHN